MPSSTRWKKNVTSFPECMATPKCPSFMVSLPSLSRGRPSAISTSKARTVLLFSSKATLEDMAQNGSPSIYLWTNHPITLVVTYSNDNWRHTFCKVLVDGQKVGEKAGEHRSPEQQIRFTDVEYPIATDLLKDKKKVTVRFEIGRASCRERG